MPALWSMLCPWCRQRDVPLLDFTRLTVLENRMLGAGSSARVYEGRFCGMKCAGDTTLSVGPRARLKRAQGPSDALGTGDGVGMLNKTVVWRSMGGGR